MRSPPRNCRRTEINRSWPAPTFAAEVAALPWTIRKTSVGGKRNLGFFHLTHLEPADHVIGPVDIGIFADSDRLRLRRADRMIAFVAVGQSQADVAVDGPQIVGAEGKAGFQGHRVVKIDQRPDAGDIAPVSRHNGSRLSGAENSLRVGTREGFMQRLIAGQDGIGGGCGPDPPWPGYRRPPDRRIAGSHQYRQPAGRRPATGNRPDQAARPEIGIHVKVRRTHDLPAPFGGFHRRPRPFGRGRRSFYQALR